MNHPRLLRLAGVAVLGCASAPPVLNAADWKVQPPVAACVSHVDGVNHAIQQYSYDADGRLIFGMTTPSVDSRASEWLTWRGDKLVAVDSYLERDESPCGGRGCRPHPMERTIQRAELEWKGTQLALVTESEIVYRRDHPSAEEVWRLHYQGTWETRYRYRGPWLEFDGSRFEFEDGRPVRRRRKMGLIFWDGPVESWTWKDGRVATYLYSDFMKRFDYDEQGRLIRERTEDQTRDHATEVLTWEYDERGAIRRIIREDYYGGGPKTEAVQEFEYDAGREIAATYDAFHNWVPIPWQATTTTRPLRWETRYTGNCAKVKQGPPAPNVFDIMHAAPCYQSPGYLFRLCF